jgi:two-component system, chemotaxis family, chemotaxis protein CheY
MSYTFKNISILVVEDNQPMTELIKSLLLVFGVGEVFTARNGKEGFDKFVAHNPDLVLTDWMMREMDGISLSRLIRNSPKSKNQFVPVIMMTGFSEKRRVIQARDAGVTEFLVKPFTAKDLYKRLEEIIERPRQFVKSDDFFGPDRRRRRDPAYGGPMRRETDHMKNYDRVVLFKENG